MTAVYCVVIEHDSDADMSWLEQDHYNPRAPTYEPTYRDASMTEVIDHLAAEAALTGTEGRTMKSRNWRTYYGYTPPSFRAKVATGDHAAQYINWLRKERGWSRTEAAEYCQKMDRRTLIRVETGPANSGSTVDRLIAAQAAREKEAAAVARLVSNVRKLAWVDLEAVQAAIDARLAA